jgi:predicted nucleic acid-binding protein
VAVAALADFTLVTVTDQVRRAAATMPGKALRSLDALHVTSAQQPGALLDVLVTYDHRVIDAARAQGLPATSPGMAR